MKGLNMLRPLVLKYQRILIILVVLIFLGVAAVVAKLTIDKSAPGVTTVQPVPATDVFTAADFAKQVYSARLAAWETDEHAFIRANPSWFTKEFLDQSATDSKPVPSLFCKKPANKPERFEAGGSSTSSDKQIATVYVSGFYQGQMEVANLPVLLKADNNLWKIHSVTCEFI